MNPYHDLPPERYWRTGVQIPAQHQAPFENLWNSKFPITRTTKIITVGSCFAQHISKWIKANHFSWVDSEPGDSGLSSKVLEQDGYGVFSFRTGNIYTPALLRQWVFQALELEPALDESFFDEGRYFDAFRPLIPANGYATAKEVRLARERTLGLIRKALTESDLLIFTLGLTEGWKNSQGYIYPVCPGTVKGQFNPEQHRFVNYRYDDIVRDLTSTIDAISAINPRMRYLLTVSPVPLTATAENQHVLSATTYSKSVLRAAAGHLAKTQSNVDYFPSYELISQFPTQGKFYEPNFRSVKKEGVDFVMAHFERGIGLRAEPAQLNPTQPMVWQTSAASSIDEYCEDILLEAWNPHRAQPMAAQSIKFFLVGDSHLDATSNALNELGLPNMGGMIMRGHTWANNGFEFDAEELFVPLDGPMARQKWLQTFQVMQQSNASQKVLITNIGLHTNVNVPRLYQWAKDRQLSEIRSEHVHAFFCEINRKNIELMKRFLAHGLQGLLISDPPTQSMNPQFEPLIPWIALYERVALAYYASLGYKTLLVRDAFPDGIAPDFYSRQNLGTVRDWVHGSPEYYKALAQLIAKRLEDAS